MMTDTFDPLGTFKSFFFANNKNVPQSTREKIALAMMLQKRKFPTTLGEGFRRSARVLAILVRCVDWKAKQVRPKIMPLVLRAS